MTINTNNDNEKRSSNMKRFLLHLRAFALAGVIFIVFITLIALLANHLLTYFITSKGVVIVPDVTGIAVEYARRIADNSSLKLNITDYEYNDLPEGTVISQIPSKGRSIYKDRTIEVSVSGGTKQVKVPVLAGFSYENLTEVFRVYELRLGEVRQRYSADIPAGFVISTNPSFGSTIVAGRPIDVVISIGPDPLTIPPPEPENEYDVNVNQEEYLFF